MTFESPHILLIDSYDSFTNNLAALCRRAIPTCTVHIIKNDTHTIDELLPHLCNFSAVIVGPGPGSPHIPTDIGVVRDLWKVSYENMVPIFGVCLGLQSLAVEHGATLHRLEAVKHGQLSRIFHTGTDIFEGVGDTEAVRYHSLHVKLQDVGVIKEVAWAEDEENGKVVMAVKHISKPFWAVQYHPESVCTDDGGFQILRNFWRLAQGWNKRRGRIPSLRPSLTNSQKWPHFHQRYHGRSYQKSTNLVHYTSFKADDLSIINICEYFGAHDESKRFIFLDSAAYPGRFSILACLDENSPQFTHYVHEDFLEIVNGTTKHREELHGRDIWTWLAEYRESRKVRDGDPTIPFWGGFAGYLSYEAGLSSLEVPISRYHRHKQHNHPDFNLIWINRSIVIDTSCSRIYVQSLLPDDYGWIADTAKALLSLSRNDDRTHPSSSNKLSLQSSLVKLPEQAKYIANIRQAQEHLFVGDSYELCLTAPTRIIVPKGASISSWERYKALRQTNAAPHSAYLRLHPTTFLSSSPERFLSYSRSPNAVCQLRPIKGTVRKAPNITREVAEQLLAGSRKEVAENLMIVDLIRHDLHSVVGENVEVKQFCTVEEYRTVWQLVSIIEGQLADGTDADVNDSLGWEVLKRSLPPGSMTGAPKKRSVEILQALEDGERGPYSGVFGYWCAGGGGDWSVTIRSCFRHDAQNEGEEEWRVGAGGAITALSDPEAEWDEMVIKLQSVLRSFGAPT